MKVAKEIEGGLTVIGLIAVISLALYLLWSLGVAAFYDPAFNDGFEAGRKSVIQQCLSEPDARGCLSDHQYVRIKV